MIIKKFQDFINEAETATSQPIKFVWKREAKRMGRQNFGYNNDKRPWTLMANGQQVADVYHPQASPNNWMDETDGWRIILKATTNQNIKLKKFFATPMVHRDISPGQGPLGPTPDRYEKAAEDAKKFVEELYTKIVNSTEAEPALFDLKQKVVQPVAEPKKPAGPFKALRKIIKDGLNAHEIGTHNDMRASNQFLEDFDNNGLIRCMSPRNREEFAKKVQSIIGTDYSVTVPDQTNIKIQKI